MVLPGVQKQRESINSAPINRKIKITILDAYTSERRHCLMQLLSLRALQCRPNPRIAIIWVIIYLANQAYRRRFKGTVKSQPCFHRHR